MAPVTWYERYGRLVENYRLPKTEAARQALAATIDADSRRLLSAIGAATKRPELAQLSVVKILRQVWASRYVTEDGRMRLGDGAELSPSAEQICSPHDPEARYSKKRDVTWVGCKVQVTETCDPACEGPHVITNVKTTPATVPDDNMLAVVHQSLGEHGLLPGEHLVDKGCTDSHVLVDSKQRYGVTIVGPVADDPSWQARLDDGLTKTAFAVDWDRRVVTCPAGKESISWLPSTHTESGMVLEARFATRDCFPCPLRPRCTRGKREPRIIGLQAREHFEVLQGARKQQKTAEFRARYAARAGIEGTHAQAVGRCGLRRCRYLGLPRRTSSVSSQRPPSPGPGRRVVCRHPCCQGARLTLHSTPSSLTAPHRICRQHHCWERAWKPVSNCCATRRSQCSCSRSPSAWRGWVSA